MTSTWHADHDALTAFVAGRLSRARSASIEAHLVSCGDCRQSIGTIVDQTRLDRNLSVVLDTIARPRPGLVERLLGRFGIPDHVVRAVLVSSADRWPWLAGIAAAVLLAVGADVADANETVLFVMLVAAPLLPLGLMSAGLRLSSDPLGEVVATTPTTRFRLLLLRSVAVLVPAVVLSATVSVLHPDRGWEPVLWLLPALGLTTTALAASTWVSVRPASWLIGGVWVVGAATAAWGTPQTELVDSFVAFAPRGQLALLAIGTVAGAIVVLRRDALDFVEIGPLA